jgi:pimeloyl-ACP methyl ester carboxylesterase
MTTSTIESQAIVKKVYRSFFSPAKYEVKSAEQEVLERGQNSQVPFAGGELAVTKWGQGAASVLLVHGWGGSRAQMTGFVDPLLAAGYRVVAFDQPAHGDSDGKITNFLEIAPTMKLIADKEGTFEGIISHSFGTLVTSYALVNLEFPSPARLVYFGALNRLMDSFPRFQAMAGLSDEIMQGFRELVEEEFGRKVLEAIRNELLAPQIRVPALMFHDATDNVTPIEDSRAIARVWNTARLTETEGLGHRGALQSDAIHEQVVDFLKG